MLKQCNAMWCSADKQILLNPFSLFLGLKKLHTMQKQINEWNFISRHLDWMFIDAHIHLLSFHLDVVRINWQIFSKLYSVTLKIWKIFELDHKKVKSWLRYKRYCIVMRQKTLSSLTNLFLLFTFIFLLPKKHLEDESFVIEVIIWV